MQRGLLYRGFKKWHTYKLPSICLLVVVFFAACSNQQNFNAPQNQLFTKLNANETGIHFTNDVIDDSAFNVITYRNFYNGGGVAIGDINNDGLADIFFTANQGDNKLFLNNGNMQFTDITNALGIQKLHLWSTGVSMADVNADGLLDIYVCSSGNMHGDHRNNELYINKGNLKFKESAADFGLQDSGAYHTQASFFDYDLDGDLDVYLLNNNIQFPVNSYAMAVNRQTISKVLGNKLLRNDYGHFTDVSQTAGIYETNISFGLGVSVSDINGDYWPDLYVSNDFFEKDYCYINQQNGTFKEVSDNAFGHMSQSSMGADIADINNDGLADVFSTDMLPEDDYRLKTNTRFDDYDTYNSKQEKGLHYQVLGNMLQLNNGNTTFSEIAQFAGVNATDWSWGALIFDCDNDGWKDITVCNGMYLDITDLDYIDFIAAENYKGMFGKKGIALNYAQVKKMLTSVPLPNYQFINQKNLQFKNESFNLGLGEPGYSNGAAYADLDNDGDMDLVVNNLNAPAVIYKSNVTERLHRNYLRIKFKGDSANYFGIGAEVILKAGDNTQVLQNYPTRGFQSSVEPSMLFGIDTIKIIDSLTVIWPGNKKQVRTNIAANTTIILEKKNAAISKEQPPYTPPLFTNITDQKFTGNISHKENVFVDFDAERLIPHLLSTEGPGLAVGDMNGDGLEDFFMSAAKYDTAKLFIQSVTGKFNLLQQPDFEKDAEYEDVAAHCFDADNDGDLDLIIASGGNQEATGSRLLQARLYLNNGKGIFTKKSAFPAISVNTACIAVCDFNSDGWQDIFIGGRNVPGNYGKHADSYLLINNKGVFNDETTALAPQLKNIGMVTCAVWEDVNNDHKKDLIITGEWMPLTIFENDGKKLSLSLQNKNFAYTNGWWNCIKAADLDNDGDIDFIAGNLGLNAKIKASNTQPAQLYLNDFDNNGRQEALITYYKSDGKSYPYYSKADLFFQLPFLKKNFLLYKDYAGKTMADLFNKSQVENAVVSNAYQFQSCVWINDGKGNFSMRPLPLTAQLAPIYCILVDDFNKDTIPDLLLAGNLYGFKPELGKMDADYGTMLLGKKDGGYTAVPPGVSGFFYQGAARDLVKIKTANKKAAYILAVNNSKLKMYQLR